MHVPALKLAALAAAASSASAFSLSSFFGGSDNSLASPLERRIVGPPGASTRAPTPTSSVRGPPTPSAPSSPGVDTTIPFNGGGYIVPYSDPTSFDREAALPADAIAMVQLASAQSIELVEQGLDPPASGSGAPTPNTDGVSYLQITDADNALQLVALPNGNLAAARIADGPGGGSSFQATDGVINQDDQGRLLLYYPDTMAARGVSRVRVADDGAIPLGSRALTLAPLDLGDGAGSATVAAVDTTGNAFFLIACSYADAALTSKVFLAQDVQKGIAVLKAIGSQAAVTGGVVKDCGYIPWQVQGFAGISG